jgi:hypothetical protein
MMSFDLKKESKCPCGAIFDLALPVQHDERPVPGRSYSMCVDCGRYMSLEHDGTWQPTLEVEILLLPKGTREQMLELRAKFKANLAQFPIPERRVKMQKLWAERERLDQARGVAANLHKPIQVTLHSTLIRFSHDSGYKSYCPTCKVGVLPIRRIAAGALLSRVDNCTHCGQFFWYTDDQICGEVFAEPAEPVPSK